MQGFGEGDGDTISNDELALEMRVLRFFCCRRRLMIMMRCQMCIAVMSNK